MFKLGDKIRCVRPVVGLESNKVYTFSGYDNLGIDMLRLEELPGSWYSDRFVLASVTEDIPQQDPVPFTPYRFTVNVESPSSIKIEFGGKDAMEMLDKILKVIYGPK